MMTKVLVVLGFALALYFPLVFAARSDWKANPASKSTMLFSTIVAAVLGLATLRQFGAQLPEWFRAVTYLSIVIGLAVQAITLTKVQNRRSARLANEARENEEARP